jgi:hypothetical protein
MKYVFYGLLCFLFTGCNGCEELDYFFDCFAHKMSEPRTPAQIHVDHPLAFLTSFRGLDLGVSSPSPDGSNVGFQSDYSLDFGFKYFFDSKNALRAGLSFGTFSDGRDSARRKDTRIGPYIGYEHHCTPPNTLVSPYIGAGASYTSWSVTSPMYGGIISPGLPTPQAASTGDVTNQYNVFRFQVMGGFDWYPFDAFAIGAEYSLGYTSTSSSTTDAAGVKTDNPTSTAFGIVGGGNVHLLIHF